MVIEQRGGGVEFLYYHVWLQGENLTSLLMTWMISGAKALLLIMIMTLLPRTFQMRRHIQNMVKVGY